MAAEAIVISVIEKIASTFADELLKPVCSLLVRWASPLEEIHSKIYSIKSEFEIMKTYLRYVETNMNRNEQFGAWVKQLREVAYNVEDSIDEYTYLVGDQQRRGFWGFLHRTIRHYMNVKAWHGLSSHLTEVNTRLLNLKAQKGEYGITDEISSAPEASDAHRQLAETSHFLHEDEIVGFEANKNLLVGWLTDEEPKQTIISVWGMGGVGKTTLVTDVYKSQIVKRHFGRRVCWVYVLQMYTAEDLLRRIIKEFYRDNDESLALPSELNEMTHRTLVGTLQNYLRDKRYLIVLDDVWHSKTWFDISGTFIDCHCRSRIVLTTRIHYVALLAVGNRVLELQPLGENYSWLLFCNKAFWKDNDRSCPRDLEYWARKIVERCQGLPLAIVAIGSLLSRREKTELEWRKVFEDLNWEDPSIPTIHRVEMILKLSFKDLPYYLRSCFMYCSIFPEDYLIKRKRIIRLWVAEGFIEQTQRKKRTMEEVAEDYLNELIHRCMLQVVTRNHFGRVKLCRMHDLMRDLTETISESENFCMFYDGEEVTSSRKFRRLSVQKAGQELQSYTGMPHVRSLVVFMTLFPQNSLNSVSASFRLLRVLDLEGAGIEELPEAVVQLFNLHYLGLRKTSVKELPKSLGRLRNLQTLDLYDTSIETLPRGITKLQKLRHLFAERHSIRDLTYDFESIQSVKAPKGLWNLKSLQTLQSVVADEETVRRMGDLTQLRSLRITKVRGIHCVELCASVSKMSHLANLYVVASDDGEELQLEALNPPSYLLQKLYLQGNLRNGVLPPWFGSLRYLRHLVLSGSKMREDPLPCLHALPNLAYLWLYKAYDGQELSFHAGGFPKLKLLLLGGSNQLDLVTIEEGAMPSLQELFLMRCGGMRLVPRGIEHLAALQELNLWEMPPEFIESLRGEGNTEERLRVQHIPTIKHIFQREGRLVWKPLR